MKTFKVLALCLLFGACATALTAQTAAQNKANALKAYEYLNAKNFDGFASLLSDNFTEHAAPEPVIGKTPAVDNLKAFIGAFPDFRVTADKVVAEGNTVMIYCTATGTFTNSFMGMEPTGKSFRVTDVDIIEFDAKGKATAHWAVQDPMVMMSQIAK